MLRDFIFSRIREGGPVPFSQFMDWCLYHSLYGYYRSGGVKIGRQGDYYTGPCVHPLFGAMVAKQLCEMDRILSGEAFTILEIGGGKGLLCADMLAWARTEAPEFYRRLTYFALESSPGFLEEQKERLAGESSKGKVVWLPAQAIEEGGFAMEGCIISNELLDAFPVHRVIGERGRLREIYVGEEAGEFTEVRGDLSDSRLDAYFAELGIALADGQEAEVNLQAIDWLAGVERCLSRGFVMTIDYGLQASELYDATRRQGSLRCFYRHRVRDNPYEKVGSQDMTCHVNFSALIRQGEKIGLDFTGLTPQYRFLIALGLFEEIERLQEGLSPVEGLKLRLSVKHLIEPERGMGEIFKVLIQHKGIERPDLAGLRELSAIPLAPRLGGQILNLSPGG